MPFDRSEARRTRLLAEELWDLAETLRATAQDSRDLAARAEAKHVAAREMLGTLFVTRPAEPVEAMVVGLGYACEHSAAYGDPAVDMLIRTALYLVGRKIAADGLALADRTLH